MLFVSLTPFFSTVDFAYCLILDAVVNVVDAVDFAYCLILEAFVKVDFLIFETVPETVSKAFGTNAKLDLVDGDE